MFYPKFCYPKSPQLILRHFILLDPSNLDNFFAYNLPHSSIKHAKNHQAEKIISTVLTLIFDPIFIQSQRLLGKTECSYAEKPQPFKHQLRFFSLIGSTPPIQTCKSKKKLLHFWSASTNVAFYAQLKKLKLKHFICNSYLIIACFVKVYSPLDLVVTQVFSILYSVILQSQIRSSKLASILLDQSKFRASRVQNKFLLIL